MPRTREIVEIARQLIARHRAGAAAVAAARAAAHLEAAEGEGAALWRQVAEAIRQLGG